MKPLKNLQRHTSPLGILAGISFCEMDWRYEHKALEKMKAETYAIYANIGYDVEISADGKFKPQKRSVIYEEEVPDDFLNFSVR